VRAELNKVWRTWSIPVTLKDAPQLYVNVDPKALGVPGITATDTAAKIVARLEADTVVATAKGPEAPKGELPKNVPLASRSGKLSLAVPLQADYAALHAAAKQVLAGFQLVPRPMWARCPSLRRTSRSSPPRTTT
jgi:hypothetical protein